MDKSEKPAADAVSMIADLGRLIAERPLSREEGAKAVENLSKASGAELVDAIHGLVEEGLDLERLKGVVAKLINLMSRPLDAVHYVPDDPFFHSLMLENEALRARLDDLRPMIASLGPGSEGTVAPIFKRMAAAIGGLKSVSTHYAKKENILFPLFESRYPRYRCVSLMWALHDDVREELNELSELLSTPIEATGEYALALIRALSGRLFYDAFALIFREEKILFPLVAGLLDREEKVRLFEESMALGFCFIAPELIAELEAEGRASPCARPNEPPYPVSKRSGLGESVAANGAIGLDAGALSPELVDLVLKSLPVDITFVDASDKVVYFSNGSERVFPRSPSIIGRDVRNCHPAKSVDKVLRIIDAFRRGDREREEFWLETGGRFVRIEYRALRGASGEYLGTLEVSQDLSGARALAGEKRLASF